MTTLHIKFEPRLRDSDGRRGDARSGGINWFGAIRTEWRVYDLHGDYALHVRADFHNRNKPGAKTLLWEHADGRRSHNREISGRDRLYLLEQLTGQHKGLLVEGEKCADAARAMLPDSWLVVATVCGASTTPEPEVLDRLAHVPTWWLWPDADANGAGQQHMARIAAYLAKRCRVRIVTWQQAPPGGDVADFLKTHGRSELTAILRAARRYV